MENINLKVSPQALNAGAADVRKTMTLIKKGFGSIESAVNNSGSYWIGDAGNAHRRTYQDMKGAAEEIFQRIEEHARDLEAMTQQYVVAEQQLTEQSNDLPFDVIV